ncbi:hypothetical protein JD844_003306 [Phrynosoma platyrhinos]|uniref:DUF4709 domain-containing protein n=1 Tax=Phrynosoma platyrhinos TaxID=52577 RepID=A0ABQ7TDC5_PHRPL|nr:hypothetical protein JD844_003306 [Phrynosoma platyrhinos]
MAKVSLVPGPTHITQEQDDMGATERARALQSTRRLSMSPNILELLSMPCCLEELGDDYRLTYNLKIGFAISDHATQTDISEIGDVKEFLTTTRTLLQFTNSVYDEFARYKSVLQQQYEEKIKEHASNLWIEINDRLKYIEDFYKQKEVKMRHSFQQQLCDALAILKAHYAKYFTLEKEIYGEDDDSLARKIERLRGELDEQAVTIQKLEEELQDYKDREKFTDRDIEIQLLKQEIWEFKEQMTSLTDRYTRLQETMKRREKEHTDLETEMQHMRERKERDMKTMQKLLTTQEILKLELDREKQRVQSKAREVKEVQDALAKLTEAKDDTMLKVPSVHEEKPDMGKKGLKGKAAKEAAAREAGAKAAAAKVAAIKETIAKEAEEKELSLESDKRWEVEMPVFIEELNPIIFTHFSACMPLKMRCSLDNHCVKQPNLDAHLLERGYVQEIYM